MFGGHLPNSLRQAAAVRNGLVQQPQGRSRFRIEQSLADQSDRLLGLGDGSVRAVNARHVADAAVAAADQHAARKRGLSSDDDVESVYQQVLSADGFERQAGLFARFSLPVRAGGPGYGQPLALFQREMIADQFQRGRRRIPAAQEPRQIGDRSPQRRQERGFEQSSIFRMRAAMAAAFARSIHFFLS